MSLQPNESAVGDLRGQPGYNAGEAKRQPFLISTILLATPEERAKKINMCKKCVSMLQNGNDATIHSTLAYSRCRCHRIFKYREAQQQREYVNGMRENSREEMKKERGRGSLCDNQNNVEVLTLKRGSNVTSKPVGKLLNGRAILQRSGFSVDCQGASTSKQALSGVHGQSRALLPCKTKSSLGLAMPKAYGVVLGKDSLKGNAAGIMLPEPVSATGVLKSEALPSCLHPPSVPVIQDALGSACKLPPIDRYL